MEKQTQQETDSSPQTNPTEAAEEYTSAKVLARLVNYIWSCKRYAVAVMLLTIVAASLELVIPKMVGGAINDLEKKGEVRMLWIFAGVILGTSLLRGIATFLRGLCAAEVAEKLVFNIRSAMYATLQRLSFGFYDSEQGGQLLSRVTSDMENITNFFKTAFFSCIETALVFLAAIALMLTMSAKLTLIALSPIPIAVLALAHFATKVTPFFIQSRKQYGRMTTVLQENVSGVRVVKGFAREAFEIDKFDKESDSFVSSILAGMNMFAFNYPLVMFIASVSTALILCYGGMLVISGTQSFLLGDLVTFLGYVMLMSGRMRSIGHIVNRSQRAVASGQRAFQLLDSKEDIADEPNAAVLRRGEGEVRFENVSFGYSPDKTVLHDINFTAQPGHTVAIVGRTGSGKTTITQLLPRFYDVTSGRITIDGVDVRDVTLQSLRQRIGMVFQDSLLFSAAIAENIAYGSPDAELERITECSKIAQAHEFIEQLPDGYETVIGERGVTLSGGQKQRLTIARALLKDPMILILDDSTSNVDTATERRIREALFRLSASDDSDMSRERRKRTIFIIAHRISTVRMADKIIVLDGGRIVGEGTHEELIETDGLYREMYDLQFGKEEQAVLLPA